MFAVQVEEKDTYLRRLEIWDLKQHSLVSISLNEPISEKDGPILDNPQDNYDKITRTATPTKSDLIAAQDGVLLLGIRYARMHESIPWRYVLSYIFSLLDHSMCLDGLHIYSNEFQTDNFKALERTEEPFASSRPVLRIVVKLCRCGASTT